MAELVKDKSITLEVMANIIMDGIKEDRTEIRLNKENIYKLISFITVSSFAITSFIIDPLKKTTLLHYIWLIDLLLIVIMLVLFHKMKQDLDFAHICGEYREKLLEKILIENTFAPHLFQNLPLPTKPQLKEEGFYYALGTSILVIGAKALFVLICF